MSGRTTTGETSLSPWTEDLALSDAALSERIAGRARALLQLCEDRGIMVATAESCTGGLIAAALTDVPGSSAVVERGAVTYANEAKQALLGVPDGALAQYGAVSEPVARLMAEGALFGPMAADADPRMTLSIAVTGIAGPGGGSAEKPEGLVHIAAARRSPGDLTVLHGEARFGAVGRSRVRALTVSAALALAQEAAMAPTGE